MNNLTITQEQIRLNLNKLLSSKLKYGESTRTKSWKKWCTDTEYRQNWIRSFNTFARGDYSAGLSVGAWNPANAATNVGNNAVSQNSIQNQAVGTNQIQNNSIGTK